MPDEVIHDWWDHEDRIVEVMFPDSRTTDFTSMVSSEHRDAIVRQIRAMQVWLDYVDTHCLAQMTH